MSSMRRWLLLILLLTFSATAVCFAGDRAVAPTKIDKPLLAHWTFDEREGPGAIRNSAQDSPWKAKAETGVVKTRGVFGNALELAGSHRLPVTGDVGQDELPAIGFSAWVRPTDLAGYREIFRQECGNRVLFSFQGDGKILSLGLNVGGYVECDARIDPAQVIDGRWHHCAATFDGRLMRVYLDGREIGSLKRPGRIALQSGVPAFIGSSGGTGEFFQGGLDDLVVYREALSAAEIARLHLRGVEAVAARAGELRGRFDAFFTRRDSFAETLAASRRSLIEKDLEFHRDMTGLLLARLRADFPDDYADFARYTGANPADYLASTDNGFPLEKLRRLIDLMVEYKPLTESQWQCQTPEQLKRWREVQRIEKEFQKLQAQGDAARFSPRWIELAIQAGRRIQFRPSVSEAVAPYRQPATPPTRDLSTEEAREVVQRDWLHQANGNPSPERIRQEIGWTRRLAERIEAEHPDRIDFSPGRARLDELHQQAAALTGPDQELYFKVRRLKRAIAFGNPVVDFDKVLFVDMPFPQGSEWPHQTRHRLGYMAIPGGKLITLEGLSPSGKLTQLMPQEPLHGSFWRPDLSYDAKTVLFCFKPHNEKAFHLYEIDVDGGRPVQLTDGQFDDFDPIYLPDGKHIIFSTTRGHTYVRCMPPTNAFVLARCDRRGKNVYLISYNNEPDYLPSVISDGRIIYTRWEYTDKPLWRAQALWVVNPDGTQVNAYWGNQSVWPDLLKDARGIPGSRRVMFTGSAHHDWFSGSVGIIDPDGGYNFPAGLTKVTAEVAWPESGNGPVDPIESPHYHRSGRYSAYYSPYPLSERDFLVSANRGGKFMLYLMDVDGNRELIYEGTNNVLHALPVRPRPRPPVIGDRVAWPTREDRHRPQQGEIYSKNVYQGAPPELRGKAKYLRVLNIEPKTYTYWHKRPYISTGPVVSMVQSDGVKRVLGTVPIEEDGSVAFHAPACQSLHFQLLDENYRALQTMRSFAGVMPAERRGCLGCHELHSVTPDTGGKAIATSRQPRRITPPPWGDESVGYVRFVQPVLDKYCGECHQGDAEGRQTLDLTLRPGFLIFNEPYVTLTGRPSWGKAYNRPQEPPPGFGIANTLMVEGYDQRDPAAYRTPEPMKSLSYNSRLIEICSNGEHYDVKVDPQSLRRLIVWIDTMCPYRGAEEVRAIPDPEFQGVDWLSIRPKIQTAPRIIRPGPVD